MKIKASSWHYRLYKLVAGNLDFDLKPKTLCAYFWNMARAIVLWIAISGVCSLFLWVALAPVWYMVGWDGFVEHDEAQRMCYVVTTIYIILGVAFGVIYLFHKGNSFVYLIYSFFKGVKDKYCPTLEIEDNE